MKKLIIAVSILLILVTAGFAVFALSLQSQTKKDIANKMFTLQSIKSEKVEMPVIFRFGEDNILYIDGLCNIKAVDYKMSGSKLTFELGATTLISCGKKKDNLETKVAENINNVKKVELEGTSLYLYDSKGVIIFSLEI